MFVGTASSYYCQLLSVNRYILKIADIISITIVHFSKKRGLPNGKPLFYAAITSKTVPVLASTKNSNRSCISSNIVVRPPR